MPSRSPVKGCEGGGRDAVRSVQTRKPNARHIGSRFRPSNPRVYGLTRGSFDLLDEIEQSLALDVTPASWALRRDDLDQWREAPKIRFVEG